MMLRIVASNVLLSYFEFGIIWNSCASRTFSYGFEGGRDFPALDTTLTADLLLRMARLGVDIGITVYPYRADDTATDARGSRRNGERDALS